MKTRDAVKGFSPAREFSQILPRFSPGYEGTDNMFYFFYKIIIFCFNKEKDYIRNAYVYLNFSHLGDRGNHDDNVIFVLHNTMTTHL